MARKTKEERRSLRKRMEHKRGGGWRVESMHPSSAALGPGVLSASPAEVLAAIEQLPAELDWETVAPRIVPLFERVRPYPPNMPKRVQAIVGPGVTIGFGIDVGPAFITVSPELLESWSVTAGDLAAQSLANLHSIAAQVRPGEVHRGPVGDIEVEALQTGRGIGSVLVLAPTELARIFPSEGGLFIAPMRDLLIRLPPDADHAEAAWLFAEIASGDPNCLTPRAFLFDGRDVLIESLALPLLAA